MSQSSRLAAQSGRPPFDTRMSPGATSARLAGLSSITSATSMPCPSTKASSRRRVVPSISGVDLRPVAVKPVQVKEAPTWLVNPLIGVGAKVIALGLQQILRQSR